MTDALATAVCHYFQQNNYKNQTQEKTKKSSSWVEFAKKNPDRLK